MEDIDIYGKCTKDIPDFNTLKILEERKYYIFKKLKEKIDKNLYSSHLIEEIRALEKTMNFIKWIRNNFENDTVKNIIEQYKMEMDKDVEEGDGNEMENSVKSAIYGIFDEKQGKNKKYEIKLSKYKDIKYIIITTQRRKEDKITWKTIGRISMTINRLEKILMRINEPEKYRKS